MSFSLKKSIMGSLAAISLVVAGIAAPAFAWSGPNKGKVWEDWFGGARVHSKIEFRPSYADHYWNGKYTKQAKHAVQGSVTLTRQAGPKVNKKQNTARYGRNYNKVVSKEIWVFDSVLWGKKYVTKGYYNITAWVN